MSRPMPGNPFVRRLVMNQGVGNSSFRGYTIRRMASRDRATRGDNKAPPLSDRSVRLKRLKVRMLCRHLQS